jgi:hypothetical protein
MSICICKSRTEISTHYFGGCCLYTPVETTETMQSHLDFLNLCSSGAGLHCVILFGNGCYSLDNHVWGMKNGPSFSRASKTGKWLLKNWLTHIIRAATILTCTKACPWKILYIGPTSGFCSSHQRCDDNLLWLSLFNRPTSNAGNCLSQCFML